jgi:hypothetical protein
MDQAVARVVYDESLRLLEVQRDAVEGARTQSGTVLAAAALVTTFLGGRAVVTGQHLSTGAWIAIGLFIACAVCAITVLMPWKFRWGQRPVEVVQKYLDDDASDASVLLRDLALKHEESRKDNRPTLHTLQWLLRASALFLLAEVVAWLVEIG